MRKVIDKENVKKIIRSLLVSAQHGLTVNELCSEYAAVEYQPLPYKELGYRSAIDLIKDMPDVVRPIYYGTALILRVVADKSTAHLNELVRRQRSTGRNARIVTQDSLKKPTEVVIPSFIQKRLTTILVDHPNGMLVPELCKEYAKWYGSPLQPKRLGLTSVAEILLACSDILYMKSDQMNQVWVYHKARDKRQGLLPTPTPIASHIPEKIQNEIVDVLSKHPNGIWAIRFQNEYKLMYKRELNFHRLGFGSLVELMADVGDRVEMQRASTAGDWLLKAKFNAPLAADAVVDMRTKYSLESPGELDELIEIYLSYIINPTEFWFQCVWRVQDLSTLMESLRAFYSDKTNDPFYKFSEEFVRTGQVCCALYEDGEWYRAIITQVIDVHNIEVFYVDYGNEGSVSLSDLRLLKKEFITMPAQALPAKLSNIKPIDEVWSKDSTQRFFELTSDRHVFGRIKSFENSSSRRKIHEKETVVTCLEMTNTNYEVDLHINNILVNENHALSTEQALEERLCYYENYYNALLQVKNMMLIPQNDTQRDEKASECVLKHDVVASTTRQLEDELETMTLFYDDVTRPVQCPVKIIDIENNSKIHMIMYNDDAYTTSGEISSLFWTGDILKQMLARAKVKIPSIILLQEDHPDIFNLMLKYKFKGLCTPQGEMKPGLTLYSFRSLADICGVFKLRIKTNEEVLRKEFEKFQSMSLSNYFQEKVPVENLEEVLMLKYQGLCKKRKRLHITMMCNRASDSVVDEIKQIDGEIKLLEKKLNAMKVS